MHYYLIKYTSCKKQAYNFLHVVLEKQKTILMFIVVISFFQVLEDHCFVARNKL